MKKSLALLLTLGCLVESEGAPYPLSPDTPNGISDSGPDNNSTGNSHDSNGGNDDDGSSDGSSSSDCSGGGSFDLGAGTSGTGDDSDGSTGDLLDSSDDATGGQLPECVIVVPPCDKGKGKGKCPMCFCDGLESPKDACEDD
jgi:hypothetical protein